MDLLRLREATTPEHEAVEAKMPVMRADLSRGEYADVLACFSPLIAGWEQWAAEHVPAPYAGLVRNRKRAPLLVSDLAALGRTTPPPVFPADDAFLTPAGFLGAMYVVEGSTLGGQHIARHVEPLLGLNPEHGTAYFRGYGEETGARWREFKEVMAAVPDELTDEVIAAAKRMFNIFGDAMTGLHA